MTYEFSEEEQERYSRHMLLKGVGAEGQAKMREAKVLLVGAGGLGSPVAYYLAAAGVGTLGIVDFDTVDTSNLQRQTLHTSADLGRPKVESAAEKLRALNPHVCVAQHRERLTAGNAMGIIQDYDFVVEATDSLAAKFLINDACVLAGKPFSHGGVLRFEGEIMTYAPGHACYRCIFNAPPAARQTQTSAQVGVAGPVAGVVGALQATEALKYFTGTGKLLTDRLLTIDAAEMAFHTMSARRSTHCPICGQEPTILSLEDE